MLYSDTGYNRVDRDSRDRGLGDDTREGRYIMAYTCKNCGAVADEPGHLCDPCGKEAGCSFCGEPKVDTAHMCKDKLAAMKFVCGGCGRVAMEEDHLCKAAPIN